MEPRSKQAMCRICGEYPQTTEEGICGACAGNAGLSDRCFDEMALPHLSCNQLCSLVTKSLDELQFRGAILPDDLANEYYAGMATALESCDHWMGRPFLLNLLFFDSGLLGYAERGRNNKLRWLIDYLRPYPDVVQELAEWLLGHGEEEVDMYPGLAEVVQQALAAWLETDEAMTHPASLRKLVNEALDNRGVDDV